MIDPNRGESPDLDSAITGLPSHGGGDPARRAGPCPWPNRGRRRRFV